MAVVLFKWLISSLFFFYHPFFVGVTEIQHNAKDQVLEISVKLFVDDFESALNSQFKTSLDLAHPKDPEKTNQLVASYLQQNLQVKVNGQAVKMEFIGYEKEREAAWCYIQVSNVPAVRQLDISNKLLYNVLDKQIHLVHTIVNGERKSTKIAFPEANISFNFP